MKKYTFILILLGLLLGHTAFAEVTFSSTNPTTISGSSVVLKINYIATNAQMTANKVNYTIKSFLPASGNAAPVLKQTWTGSFTAYNSDGTSSGSRALNAITLDTAKHAVSTKYTVQIYDDGGSFAGTAATSEFTTPASFTQTAQAKHPAVPGDFYYTSDYDLGVYASDLHFSFFRFVKEEDCITSQKKAIDKDYTNDNGNRGYTRSGKTYTGCFPAKTAGVVPTLAEFRNELKPYGTFPSSVPLYYYSYMAGPGNGSTNSAPWVGSIGFVKEADCKIDEAKTVAPGRSITSCKAYNSPLLKPADWNENGGAVGVKSVDIKPYNSDYVLLAPIGNIYKMDKETTITDYLNIIFKLGIGLLIALSVIMLIVHGVQYMGDESIFGKTEAMHSMRSIIGGILLALGAWAILNTINPDLVKTQLDDSIPTVGLDIKPNSLTTRSAADSARCVEVKTGPCAISNLTDTFGNKSANMSKICSMESGGNQYAGSTTDPVQKANITDKCNFKDANQDEVVFSFGLFQINMLANGKIIKDDAGKTCENLFESKDGSALKPNYTIPGTNKYDCRLKPGDAVRKQYETCKAILLDPAKNIAIAKILFDQGPAMNTKFGNLFAWQADAGTCPSAFEQ